MFRPSDLGVIAVALSVVAINPWIGNAGLISDAEKAGVPLGRQEPSPIPKAWGRVAGVTVDKWLVLEAADGTIRIVNLLGGMKEVKRN